jgi:hypothetical protein
MAISTDTRFANQWFLAAVAVDGVLMPSRLYPPGSDVRIGAGEELNVPADTLGPMTVVSAGARLHLVPGGSVRMSGPDTPVVEASFTQGGPTVALHGDRANASLHPRVSLFLRCFPTRSEAEDFLELQRKAATNRNAVP